ncbi:MAG: YIEGIA domain-containing protein [Christensenellales bacterium]
MAPPTEAAAVWKGARVEAMDEIHAVLLGTFAGTVARLSLLRVDYRQYPSTPQGFWVHFVLGMLASALGAVAVPAILSKNWVAVTFLAMGAQHFREIRNMERTSLETMEHGEYVRRGGAYIEDIAKKFESRNYIALLTGMLSCIAAVFAGILAGGVTAVVCILGMRQFTKSLYVRMLAKVEAADFQFDGFLLKIDGVVIKNVGLKESRKLLSKHLYCCKILPQSSEARITLAEPGQRAAIVYDVCTQLGMAEDDEPDLHPFSKYDGATGAAYIGLVLRDGEEDALVEAVKNCVILEGSRKKPAQSKAGEMGGKDDAR